MSTPATIRKEVTHFHMCPGAGGGAKGFNRGFARVGMFEAVPRCLGGIDNDAAGLADFERVAGVRGTCRDLFTIEQFTAFHGRPPPADYREVTPDDVRAAAGYERPNVVFMSTPCKGYSGLLAETQSRSPKYQALNALALRAVWLPLEAWKDDPPEFFLFENVPRIMQRGRHFLDQIRGLFEAYGYAFAETKHDCGELGGLAQSRKRFLAVARHREKVPPFLYEPPKRRLRGVGEILSQLPLPGDPAAGPMHRMPSLQWRTWVRLAFVEAGSDWRSLNKLQVADGVLRDFGIMPEVDYHAGVYGVNGWYDTAPTVTGRGSPTNGAYSVADPRAPEGAAQYQQYGVRPWADPAGAVINVKSPGQGTFSVADPRLAGPPRFNNTFRIVRFDETSPAVAGPGGPVNGLAVADPRADGGFAGKGKYRVTGYDEPSGTIIGGSTTGQGAFAVADPRTGYGENAHRNKLRVHPWEKPTGTVIGSDRVGSGAMCVADPRPEFARGGRPHYQTGGHYGVTRWEDPSFGVTGSGQHDNGRWSVADPRPAMGSEAPGLPAAADRLVAVIRALDGTWHRPFTTYELGALQSYIEPGDGAFVMEGTSDSAWRERIGNMVPPHAAQAIMSVIARTLLLAWSGQSFMLSSDPIWVQPLTIAMSLDVPALEDVRI